MRKRVTTVRRTYKKIGRNDPCYCGSGIKLKKCCKNVEGAIQKVKDLQKRAKEEK